MISLKDPLLVVWEAINLDIETDVFPMRPMSRNWSSKSRRGSVPLTTEPARRAELELTVPPPAGGALH